MFVAVNDHAKLSPPVTQMVVGDHVMSHEAKHSSQSVADHGRADMPDMHWLGDIGGRIIDHKLANVRDLGNAQSIVTHGTGQARFHPRVVQRQIDEPRPRDLDLATDVIQLRLFGNRGRDLARGLTQLLGQRHCKIGLVVAKLSVRGGFDHPQQVGGHLFRTNNTG